MPYWNDLVTEKSWEKLQELKRMGLKFVLIGGWAAWLYSKSHKSKDIDIIVDFEELGKIRQMFDLKKNDRLRKYEFRLEEIDVDVYVEHFSRLAIPAEDAVKDARKIEGFEVVKPEVLLALKQGAEQARGESEKGLKDRVDIMDLLLKSGIDFREYGKLLERHGIRNYKRRLIGIVQGFREIKYLNLAPGKFKKKKLVLLNRIKESV